MDFRIGPFNPWGVSNALPQPGQQPGGVQGSFGPIDPSGLVNGWDNWQIPSGSFQDRNRQALGMPPVAPPMPPANIPLAQGPGEAPRQIPMATAGNMPVPPQLLQAPNGQPMAPQLPLEAFLPEILAMIQGDQRAQQPPPQASQEFPLTPPAPNPPSSYGPSPDSAQRQAPPRPTPREVLPQFRERPAPAGEGMYRHRSDVRLQMSPQEEAAANAAGYRTRTNQPGWGLITSDMPPALTAAEQRGMAMGTFGQPPVPMAKPAPPVYGPPGPPPGYYNRPTMDPAQLVLQALYQGNSGARSRRTQGQGGPLNRRIGSRDK